MNFFTVLYKPGYGSEGLELLNSTCDMYKERTGIEFDYERTDCVMANIITEIELDEDSEEHTKIAYLEDKFKNCWFIHEYDGSESVRIDMTKYRLKLIKEKVLSLKTKLESISDFDIDDILSDFDRNLPYSRPITDTRKLPEGSIVNEDL